MQGSSDMQFLPQTTDYAQFGPVTVHNVGFKESGHNWY
jgi:hypothetical protein